MTIRPIRTVEALDRFVTRGFLSKMDMCPEFEKRYQTLYSMYALPYTKRFFTVAAVYVIAVTELGEKVLISGRLKAKLRRHIIYRLDWSESSFKGLK